MVRAVSYIYLFGCFFLSWYSNLPLFSIARCSLSITVYLLSVAILLFAKGRHLRPGTHSSSSSWHSTAASQRGHVAPHPQRQYPTDPPETFPLLSWTPQGENPVLTGWRLFQLAHNRGDVKPWTPLPSSSWSILIRWKDLLPQLLLNIQFSVLRVEKLCSSRSS